MLGGTYSPHPHPASVTIRTKVTVRVTVTVIVTVTVRALVRVLASVPDRVTLHLEIPTNPQPPTVFEPLLRVAQHA